MQDMSTAASNGTPLNFTTTSPRVLGPTDGFSDLHLLSNTTAQHWNVSPTSSGSSSCTQQDPGSVPTLFIQSFLKPSPLGLASAKRSTTFLAEETPPLTPHLHETDKVAKRQRNTEAARRYRKRKEDRQSELEEALAAMTKERDDLRLQLARSEAEADVLRKMAAKRD